jgi:hypothetical protein
VDVPFRLGTTCDRAACSMDKNGPTSFPLGLMTPMVPAIVNNSRLFVEANVKPDQTDILYQSEREYTTGLSGDGGVGQGGRRLSPLAPLSSEVIRGAGLRRRTHAAAIQATGAGGRYPSELCGRIVL